MKLIYIDESGNTGTKSDDPQQKYHLLAALFVNDINVRSIESEIKTLGFKHFGAESLNTDFEFHGYQIHKGKGRYFSKVKIPKRIEIMTDLLTIIVKNDLKIVYTIIDKLKSKANLHPHQLAFLLLVERIEDHLKHTKELGLLIADENRDIEQRLIDDLERFKTIDTEFGYRPTKIEHIVDSIHFVKSHNNPLIQLADTAAFIILRETKVKNELIKQYIEQKTIGEAFEFEEWMMKNTTLSQKTELAHFQLIEKTTFSKKFP